MRQNFGVVFWMRFGLLLAIALVPVLVAVATFSPRERNLDEIAEHAAREYDRLIQLREQQVFSIAAFPSIRAFAASSPTTRSQRAAVALNELQAWVAADTNVREAFVTDENGVVIMTTLEGWNDDVSRRQFVADALAGQLAVSPVAQDRGEFSNYYAAPILDNEKNIAGALVIRVAAQELWGATPQGANYYAVLSDENGARLDDTGDAARRLMTFAPLDAARAAEVLNTQLYGTQMPTLRATNLPRAQQLLTQGAPDQLDAADFGASAVAAQRLVSKPWTVLALAQPSSVGETLIRIGIPVLIALVLAFGGAFALKRL